MPNNSSFYDNTKLSFYIELSSNNSEFNTHIINELNNHHITSIILDLKNASNDISIDFLIEKLKQFGNVITLTNSKLSPSLQSKIESVSSTTINYDTLSFRDEKQREDFEQDITTNILNLPIERVDKLVEFNQDVFNNAIEKDYLELILSEYGPYLSANAVDNLKNTVINTNGLTENEILYNIFSSIVNPAYSSKLNADINEKIKQSFIDLAIIDFSKKHHLMLNHEAKYPNYIIYIKEKISFLDDEESLTKLLFNGNIDTIIELIGLSNEELLEELQNVDKSDTSYDKLLHDISSLSPKYESKLNSILFKLSSRVNSKQEALGIINQTISELMPEIKEQTANLITSYLNQKDNIISI